MSLGRKRGDTERTEGAWLVTRADDGTTTREPLHTFDPFRAVRPRAAYGTHDPASYAAWKRERLRLERHEFGRVRAQERAFDGAATVARNDAVGR